MDLQGRVVVVTGAARGIGAAMARRFAAERAHAGVAFGRGIDATAEDWAAAWSVNVMAHVFAARAVLPSMLERGDGYLLQTCSAAGLLTAPGDAPYTASKHAAVAFAEWLAVTYGDKGIRVSVLCPQGVRTNMLLGGLKAG